MAKDIDLTSSEWCDLVFEGKNKAYGAYDMRQNHPKRHNRCYDCGCAGCDIRFSPCLTLLAASFLKRKKKLK